IEPAVGAFYLAPFLPVGLFVADRIRTFTWMVLVSSAAIVLFLSATGFTTQRYEVDFLPAAVLAAVAACGVHLSRIGGPRRVLLRALFAIAVACGILVNLALGIAGPYDEML